ncbi:ADP-ribosyltransferase, partial [Bacillus thuringiensis]|uniref:ADP-ribosyltransferase n=1 Tax=Bacillus thuringiensis TaxID=1428 RepID=UPI0021B4460B
MFGIRVGKGIDGVYLGGLSEFRDEMELVVGRKMRYEVKNIWVVKEEEREYVVIDGRIRKGEGKWVDMVEERVGC